MGSSFSELESKKSLIQTGHVSVDVSSRGEACTFQSVYCTINKVPAAVFIASVFEVTIKNFNFSSEFMAEAFRQI